MERSVEGVEDSHPTKALNFCQLGWYLPRQAVVVQEAAGKTKRHDNDSRNGQKYLLVSEFYV
jgi:hypothetical protein